MLIALQLMAFTGYVIHEILAIIFMPLMALHVFFCFKGYKGAFKAAFKEKKTIAIVKVCVVLAVCVSLILQVLSGIIISQFLFGASGVAYNSLWFRMHVWVARILLVLFTTIIALFIKDIVKLWSIENKDE